ncbi:uncharacterized protein EI97DRAFT_390360 [Westerdykella ornata]|uniref:Mediator of RNA polymerase II transcription subunit 17 n=1 Tax=Westerdykella ornata TaxID=318751 RepID=A0A6A6JY74_WESOR|nr:uncharacterized protein EI97DRAFT_390360 [Westerdykella ornata]KAF2281581.1 hypothetical protein EI97DRAFT_390360 [Westerdykella ornata]
MSASDATATVFLRPLPSSKNDDSSPAGLQLQLERLAAERGFLRDVTEESLQKEIEEGRKEEHDDAENIMEGVEGEEEAADQAEKDDTTLEDRQKELLEARNKMLNAVQHAGFYALNTLDLISFLLSRDPKRSVETSMSPGFKAQNFPRGSFAIGKTPHPFKDAKELKVEAYKEERVRLASRGSRMKALETATGDILKAATQLETEVRKEVQYWNEILAISEKGWPLQRLRKDVVRSPFAVRYGSPEASDHFKARGLAPLKMDKDGKIILDPSLTLKPKTLRVRVSENGVITAESRLTANKGIAESDIEESIKLARNSVFEEEIYHEICIEARDLLPYGVETRNSVVELELSALEQPSLVPNDKKILIDCIPLDEDAISQKEQTSEWVAEVVAQGLRLLLGHEHRMRRYRRATSSRSTPAQRPRKSSPPLLRTLLAIVSHHNAVNSLQQYLELTGRTLKAAGVNVTLNLTREKSMADLSRTLSKTEQGLDPIHQVLELLVKPLEGVAKLSFPSNPKGTLVITVRTSFGPPTYGTQFKITVPEALAATVTTATLPKRDFRFQNLEEVRNYLYWALSLDMAHGLLAKQYGKQAEVWLKEPRFTVTLTGKQQAVKKIVEVELQDARLSVTVGESILGDMDEGADRVEWSDGVGEGSLVDKVRSLVG